MTRTTNFVSQRESILCR